MFPRTPRFRKSAQAEPAAAADVSAASAAVAAADVNAGNVQRKEPEAPDQSPAKKTLKQHTHLQRGSQTRAVFF